MKNRPPLASTQYKGHWIYTWPYGKFTVLGLRTKPLRSIEDAKAAIDKVVA